MKLCTYWWGVHLVATNDNEAEILMNLYKVLKNPLEEEIYEEGKVTLFVFHEREKQLEVDFSYIIEEGNVVLVIVR